jgi:hypothetical protein
MKRFLTALIWILLPMAALASNSTTMGSFAPYTPGTAALYTTIGVVFSYTNDDNQNNSAVIEYKKSSDSTYLSAYAPFNDRRTTILSANDNLANYQQFRVMIVGLASNTSYDVRITVTDPDGITGSNPVSTTVTTITATPPTGGTNYYVNSSTGNDGNAGTSSGAAWLTTSHALANTVAGDIINCNGSFAALTFNVSGNSGAYRKMQPESGQTCTINAGTNDIVFTGNFIWIDHLTMGASTTGSLFSVGSQNHIYISSNTAADFSTSGTWDTGAVVMNGAHDIYIINNTFTRTSTTIADSSSPGTNGIGMNGDDYNIVISGNAISGTVWDSIGNFTNSSLTSAHNHEYTNNTNTNYWDDGTELDGAGINVAYGGNTNVTNVAPQSKNPPANDNGATGLSDAGIIVGPGYIYRNYLVPALSDVVKGGHNAVGQVNYFHNTIYAQASSGGHSPLNQSGGTPESQNHVFRNNIFLSVNQNIMQHEGSRTGNSYDYDLAFCTSGCTYIFSWNDTTNYTNWTGVGGFVVSTGMESHSVNSNPSLDGSYHIASSSPAYQAGVAIANFNGTNSAWPYSGSAPDIGAFVVPSSCTPSKVVYTAQPSNAEVGSTLTVSVSVEDSGGNVCTPDTSTVTLSSHSGSTAATLQSSSSLSKAASAGVATWTDLFVSPTTGTISIDAADGALTGATSSSITISCTPSKVVFTSQPGNTTIGSSLGTVTVAVQDSSSITCSADTSSVTIANKAATCTGMTLGGTAMGNAAAGVFTTSNLTENAAGACTLHATDGALTAADSSAFTISATASGSSRGRMRRP